jgi:PhnB protein
MPLIIYKEVGTIQGGPMKVKPIPEGYRTITPYLAVPGVANVIEFLKKAFDAREIERHALPEGTVMNAALKLGDSMIMLGENRQGQKAYPAMLYLYVEDVDAVFKKAVEAGGKVIMGVVDQFYGDRSGAVEDAAGNQWWIATRKENVSGDELMKRAAKTRDSLSPPTD